MGRTPAVACCLVVLACAAGDEAIPPPLLDLSALDREIAARVEAASAAVRGSPADARTWCELAMVLEANELDGPAEEAWRNAATSAPDNARAWCGLARVRERRGDVAGALDALQRTLALAADYAPAHARFGRLLLESGRLDEAEAALGRARALDPGSPAAALGLARLALLRAQLGAAIATLEELLRRCPEEPYAHGLLARAYAMQGDAASAERHLRAESRAGASAVDDPWLAEVRQRACGTRVRLERVKARLAAGDAEAAWAELVPLEPPPGESAPALVLGAQCQVLLALGRPAEALARLERAGPLVAQHSFLVLDRALALRDAGDPAGALAAIESDMAGATAQANAHLLRAQLLFELERFADAITAFEAAHARDELTLADAILLARARVNEGDLAGGLRELERAAAQYPEAPKPWAYRSEFLALDGRAGEARASLDEARRRGLEPELVARVAARLDELGAGAAR